MVIGNLLMSFFVYLWFLIYRPKFQTKGDIIHVC
jgi:hypothetical protein